MQGTVQEATQVKKQEFTDSKETYSPMDDSNIHTISSAGSVFTKNKQNGYAQTPQFNKNLPDPNVTVLVLGGAGFIGSHLSALLVSAGRRVVVADRQPCAFLPESKYCSSFVSADLRDASAMSRAFAVAACKTGAVSTRLWVFLMAADMGGMGYIAPNISHLMLSNTRITANALQACLDWSAERLFIASSACVYPQTLQTSSGVAPMPLAEDSAWPADPQDGYGMEKLYAEELAIKSAGSSLSVRIARFHNVYGPRGSWVGGREKAPAAFLRKTLLLRELDECKPNHSQGIQIWGNGSQARTFCYITDAVDGVLSLMSSDLALPVNIGSAEAVTVKELAIQAGKCAGLDVSLRLIFEQGPLGVQGRSADLARAKKALGWEPKVTLSQGLRLTSDWIKGELALLKSSLPSDSWEAFVRSGLTSVQAHVIEVKRFGILLPITSRMRGWELVEGLRSFLRSLSKTALYEHNNNSSWQFNIYFGVDKGDDVCDPNQKGALDLPGLVREELPLAFTMGQITAQVSVYSLPPGSVCHIWADLAATAFTAGCDYTVLLGDDVVLKSIGWPDLIHKEFENIATERKLPLGFGCVAFMDEAFPGFPTFPVIHRTHISVLGGRIFPSSFINQDADPFLFQLYRAFGAAKLLPTARLNNTIGGAGDARYKKRHVPWTGQTLADARVMAAAWLERHAPANNASVITLDVIVPTYRVNKDALERILALPIPPGISTQFTIVGDNPSNANASRVLRELESAHCMDPMVRIRTNTSNLGAGPTRNRGLSESAADWVLFLDDDVVPDVGILSAYADSIRAHPRATGFIGLSILPPPVNARQAGVHMAGVAFFWGIANANPGHTELPWGVTANLCVRRPPPGSVEFNADFPHSGGGEDIDFCLRLRESMRARDQGGEGFVAAPDAIITHPWWDSGVPALSHFSGWAGGDGHLIDLFPKLTYRNLPDLAETLLVLSILGFTAATSVATTRSQGTVALTVITSTAVGCIVGDALFDLSKEFMFEPHKECANLSLSLRFSGSLQGLLIRTVSEAGRLMGHAQRGTLLNNVCLRFNWFGYMWSGAPTVERIEATKRTFVRLSVAATAAALTTFIYYKKK
jgi:nucleoside-diphosphate-sugar epimerase/GT2 family glycosyltransferase